MRISVSLIVNLVTSGMTVEKIIDVVVTTPQHIQRHRESIGRIYGPSVREGRMLYERVGIPVDR